MKNLTCAYSRLVRSLVLLCTQPRFAASIKGSMVFVILVITLIGFAPMANAAILNDASRTETLENFGINVQPFSIFKPVLRTDKFTNQNQFANQILECGLVFSSPTQNFSAAAGSGSFAFTATPQDCQVPWTASTGAPWIHIVNPSGTANGSFPSNITFNLDQNNTGASRSGQITVTAGSFQYTLTVNQAAPCSFGLSASNANFTATGGSGGFTVNTAAGCAWTAGTGDSWIHITSGAGGSGTGTVSFTVDANSGPARVGSITAAGITFTITQDNGCTYTLVPTSTSVASAGGNGSFDVLTGVGCTWTATTNDSFINITSGQGNGSGTVTFTVQANSGAARTGTITVADKSFTIHQDSACSYSLAPTGIDISASGGNTSFNVITQSGCGWTAVSNDSWIHITSGAGGTGNGSVAFSVDVNTGIARTGTITVGSLTFTIRQSSGCTFLLSPTNTTLPIGGGSGSFNVSAASNCTWNVQSNDSWIHITNGSGGTGNGTVSYSVDSNPGPTRTGTITAGGETFTITQGDGCSIALTPAAATFPVGGGNGSFGVTVGPGCSWSPTTNSPWIHITSGPGNGNGTATFTVDANPGAPRSGTISVGSQSFTVNQNSTCSYSIQSNVTVPFPPTGGQGQVTVTAPAGCEWLAVSNVPWIIINSGSGSGNGSFTFTVQPNSGPSRSGQITVGDQAVFVSQVEGCAVNLTPTRVNVPAHGGEVRFTVSSGAGCAWDSFSKSSWISIISGQSGTGDGFIVINVSPNERQSRSGTVEVHGKSFTVFQAGFIATRADFDGDGKTDASTYRPSEGNWYLLRSQLGIRVANWGNSTDVPTPGDFDNDSKTDIAVYRPSSGQWFIVRSSDNTFAITSWGSGADKPVVADYDGDGSSDIAVYRPSTGQWFVLLSSDLSAFVVQWGAPSDVPVQGYYDSDSKTDIAVYRPSNGTWYVLASTGGGYAVNWGAAGDRPVPADYDGDSRDDIAVYRPSDGNWFVLRSSDLSGYAARWGQAGDIPIPGDYDGDNHYDIAQYRPSTGQWLILGSSSGFREINWGTPADKPVPEFYIP